MRLRFADIVKHKGKKAAVLAIGGENHRGQVLLEFDTGRVKWVPIEELH